jgi:hypothetical protein
VPGPAREIHQARQWAVDAWRRHLQRIFAFDRVLALQHVRQRARKARTILDVHLSIGALGHHLQRVALARQKSEPHEPVTGRFHGRGDDGFKLRHCA